MILSDFISPDVMVARSVNLERDMGDEVPLRHYHLTGKGLEILSRLTAALNGERISAWSLTGPYGMGKSSFANYLLALCGPEIEKETRIARKMLEEKDVRLADHLYRLLSNHSAKTKGFLRIAVTSSFESINRTLANGLKRALLNTRHFSKNLRQSISELIQKADQLSRQAVPETMELVELFKAAAKVHGAPIAVLIDEFGKNLEFMARFPSQGDLFILQALAESDGIFIWVCLHQAFEEYTSRLSARQLQEWGKIQGRFEDISFVEPKQEMIGFICDALTLRKDDPVLRRKVRAWAETFFSEIQRLALPELRDLDVDTVERFYPLHPLTAVVLPELCIRFAQNDRTLFAFLCSGEPNALPAFLSSQVVDPNSEHVPTFSLELLYDYFLTSSNSALMNRPESHRWMEINDIIERSRSIEPFHYSVLKAIGLLNLISGPSRFRSSGSLVSFAFLRPFTSFSKAEEDLHKAIAENIKKGVLIYREYADEYRLWEGTDFDIPAAIRERKLLLSSQSLEEVLESTLPLTPLAASRHSYVTGTLRHFERHWRSTSQDGADALKCLSPEADGLVLYCFGKDQDPPAFPAKTDDGLPLIVGYAACEDQIRDLILDAAAAKAVLQESPELERDGVARKEARFRAYMAEERLRAYLTELFTPGNQELTWFALGESQQLGSHRDLSRMLSRCCDEIYCSCPVLRNELINRNQLSSAAARARRELMDAMVSKESDENLGLQGTGPEVAIYRTMLLAEALHLENDDSSFHFVEPNKGSTYWPLWGALTDTVRSAGEDQLPVTHLIERLRRPPFGLKDGPIPIIICLFLIIKSEELALYQDGSFVPFFGAEEMELMTKRPEYFTVRRVPTEGVQGRVLQIYSNLLNAQSITHKDKARNETVIAVAGPLVQFVNKLPYYVRHTRSLSSEAKSIRQILQQARDPIQLLFFDLPQAVGLPAFDDDHPATEEAVGSFQIRLRTALTEISQSYKNLIRTIETNVLEFFKSEVSVNALREQLRVSSQAVLKYCKDGELRPFVTALASFSGSDQDWLISLATISTQRPVDSWRDNDAQAFPIRMADLARRFFALETVAAAINNLPDKRDGKEPRLISITWPDGKTSSEVLWMHQSQMENLHQDVTLLRQKYSEAELKSLFLLLGERLYGDPKGQSDDDQSE